MVIFHYSCYWLFLAGHNYDIRWYWNFLNRYSCWFFIFQAGFIKFFIGWFYVVCVVFIFEFLLILLVVFIQLVDCDQDTCDTLYILAMTFLSRWFYRNLAWWMLLIFVDNSKFVTPCYYLWKNYWLEKSIENDGWYDYSRQWATGWKFQAGSMFGLIMPWFICFEYSYLFDCKIFSCMVVILLFDIGRFTCCTWRQTGWNQCIWYDGTDDIDVFDMMDQTI